MKKVCTFTGAAMGEDPIYAETAFQLGQMIASRQLGLVYGGGKMGLMGQVADGVIDAGGIKPQPNAAPAYSTSRVPCIA